MIKNPRRVQPHKIYRHELIDNMMLEGVVSPCVFMDTGYPLQIKVVLKLGDGSPAGEAFLVNRDLNAATATEADVVCLLPKVRVGPCHRCGAPAFDPNTVETNRGGLCESCFVWDIDREIAKELEAESQRLAERDRKMKKQGMKYRVTAWIHADEGDDCPAEWYFRERPSEYRISHLLQLEGSSVLDDFEMIEL